MRWWRYGVKPSGTSGNGSPPSGASFGWERDGEVRALEEVLLLGEEVVQHMGERRVGGAEAGGEEVPQRAGDLVGDDGGDHGGGGGFGGLGWWGDGGIDW